jgi:opacity protein-like surface antigen
MRKLLLVVAATVCCLTLAAQGAALSQEERAFFDKNISKIVQVEPSRLSDSSLERVFQAPFYKVTITINQGESGTQTMDLTVARVGQELVDVSLPGTNQDLPQFKKMLKPDFKLKTDKDAKDLQAALDILYPISSSFGGEDAKAKAIKHSGKQWTFVRGVFFKKNKGFSFTTDANGTITDVKYSLELP